MDTGDISMDKWKSQLRKGFFELCVLALVAKEGRAYGFDMMESLGRAGIEISEGTLYPLLARLVKDGSLAASWETPETGHPRKYYRLSEAGGPLLGAMRKEYESGYASYRSIAQGGLE